MTEPTESSKKFRSQFDYVLKNLQKMRASKRLELFPFDSDLDLDSSSYQITPHMSPVSSIDANDSFADENDINESDLKIRGEEDMKRNLSEDESQALMDSLKNINSFKELNFQQINCLIKSFEQLLRQLICDQNNSSYFAKLYQSCGYPGITSTIQMSLFSKSQKSYILGCLYGLFPGDHKIGPKVFSVLFPETLIRIVMNVNRIDYNTALDIMKPISD